MANIPLDQEFQFVAAPDGGAHIEGSITADGNTFKDTSSGYGLKQQTFASRYLHTKGFDWLLEEDDLDEEDQKPLLEELDIDLKDIYYKVRCVLLPLPYLGFNRQIVRESPDFWGPLIIVLMFTAVSLYGQFGVVSWILTIWVCGSFIIFMLARVLGGEVTFAQCLGVIGYSVLPLLIVGTILPFFQKYIYITMLFKFLAVIWASYSAGSLLSVRELQHKKLLLLYPIFLLYIYFLSLYTGA